MYEILFRKKKKIKEKELQNEADIGTLWLYYEIKELKLYELSKTLMFTANSDYFTNCVDRMG